MTNRGDSGLGFPVSSYQATPSSAGSGLTAAGTVFTGAVSRVSLPSNDNISAGDVVTLGADGNAYWAADPANSFGALRPVYQGSTALMTILKASQTLSSTGFANFGVQIAGGAILSNGNNVFVWGQSTTTGPAFAIFDQNGNQVVAPTSVGLTGNEAQVVAVGALVGGGFVIAGYSGTSTYTPYFVIYNNAGQVVTALTNFDTTAFNSAYRVNVIPLNNGTFALAWGASAVTTGTAGYKTAVYSATGNVISAPAVLQASGGGDGGSGFTSCALPGGGYVVAFGAGSTAYAYVMSNTGAQITSVNQGPGVTVTMAKVVPLLSGGFGFVSAGAGTTVPYGIYTASGGTVGSGNLTMPNTVSWLDASPGAGSFGGLFVAAGYSTSTATYYAVVSAAGTVLKSPTTANTSGYSNSNSVAILGTLDGGAVLTNNSSAQSCWLMQIAPSTYVSSTPILGPTAGGDATVLLPITPTFGSVNPTIPGFWIFGLGGGAAPSLAGIISVTQTMVPIGVALAGAVAGTSVQVAISGQVVTRLTFKQPYNVDARGNSPPGQALSLVGNVATMLGIQKPTPRNIN